MLLHRYGRIGLGHLLAISVATAATATIAMVGHVVHVPDAVLLYIPAILLVAVYFGTGPSLTVALAAGSEYDFFLVRPFHSLVIDRTEDLVAFGIFVLVAVLTSQLASQARTQVEGAQRRASESETLYELGQALMSTQDGEQILQAITSRIVDVFHVDRCAIFVPGTDGDLRLAAETVRAGRRTRASQSTADWAFRQGTEMTLAAEGGKRRPQRLYVPLRAEEDVLGVLEVGLKRSGSELEIEERRLVTSFAAQASLVIARARSEEERRRLEVVKASDRLKSALLNAVSHDLRTPLASIKGSATALLLSDFRWSTADGREFLETIVQEADRLNRLVGSLLDLSRIEAGVLRPVLEWYDIEEIAATIVPQLRRMAGDHPLVIDIEPGIPECSVDLLRLEELLTNLVENAAKYAPTNSAIELRFRYQASELVLSVIDRGPGIPPEQRPHVFDTFYQGGPQGDRHSGVGLGLAICRGVAQAHGGSIELEDSPGGGATFVVRLPMRPLDSPVPQ